MRRVLLMVFAMLAVLSLGAPTVTDAQSNPCTSANLHPNNNALQNGQLGQPYSERLWMTPANPCIPGIWTSNPNPPFPGVNLVPGPGADEAYLVGTPTATGTFTFTITAGGIFVCGTICFVTKTYTVTVT